MKKNKQFLEPDQLYSLHSICRDFTQVLKKERNENEYNLEDENVSLGMDLGIRSALILFSSYLIDENGKFNESEFTKLVKSSTSKHHGRG